MTAEEKLTEVKKVVIGIAQNYMGDQKVFEEIIGKKTGMQRELFICLREFETKVYTDNLEKLMGVLNA